MVSVNTLSSSHSKYFSAADNFILRYGRFYLNFSDENTVGTDLINEARTEVYCWLFLDVTEQEKHYNNRIRSHYTRRRAVLDFKYFDTSHHISYSYIHIIEDKTKSL